MLSGSTAPGTGFFNFPGLSPTSVTWTIDGYDTTYTYSVDHLEYYIPASATTSTTSSGLPTTFTLPADATWFYIYVNKTTVENKTVIWGYLYDYTYTPLTGRYIKIIDPPGGGTEVTDPTGMYVFYVTPGAYTITPILIGGGSVIYHDYTTSSSGLAPWHNSVVSGEVRRVDFIVKDYRPPQNCSAIAGVAYLNPSTPLPGVYVKAAPASVPYGVYDYTDVYGFFNFHPLCSYLGPAWSWAFTADMPGYTLDRIEYHILGTSSITTVYSPTFTFTLSSSTILWVEIYYNKTQPCNGTVFGKIYKLYSYAPAEGASVSIYSTADPTTPIETTTTGPDGLYTFTVPAGTYIIKVNLPGYYPASATVDVICGEETYKPFYLVPRIEPIPVDPIRIKLVHSGNDTPIQGATIVIDGVGKGITNESGGIQFKLYSEGNYTIKVMHDTAKSVINNIKIGTILGPIIVFVSTSDDEGDLDEEEEEIVLDPNPDGTYHLKPGMHYKIVVLPLGGAQEKPQEKKGEYTTTAVAGVAVAALVVGGVAGFLLRGRPGEGYMGE